MSSNSINNYTYVKRKFKYLEQWNIEKFQLKVYTIINSRLPDNFNPPTAAALNYTTNNLSTAANNEGNSHDLGFVVIHYGQGHIWLLIHWWAHNEICCQIMAHSEEKNIEFTDIGSRPVHACIWENKIINYENQLWIDSMLNSQPNPTKYLNTSFEDGSY